MNPRCYPERRLIRLRASRPSSASAGQVRLAGFLNTGLDDAENGLIEEVLCHELAHIAARELRG